MVKYNTPWLKEEISITKRRKACEYRRRLAIALQKCGADLKLYFQEQLWRKK